MTMNATVIGGGIAGAAAAIGLTREGWRVQVRERARHAETSGAALGIWPAALAALDELGIGDEVRRVATPQGSGSLRRPDGSRIAAISADRLRRRVGDEVYLVARRDLAEILAAALPAGVIRYGVAGAVGDDASRDSDLLVVADGVFSAGRAALLGDRYRARHTGQVAFRGRVALATDAVRRKGASQRGTSEERTGPNFSDSVRRQGASQRGTSEERTGPNLNSSVSETWGPGCRFGITPYRDGTTNWYAAITTTAPAGTPGDELRRLRAMFGDWHDPIPRILAALTEEDVMRHDLYDVHPPLPSYVVGRAVLLGDAAHAMTPDLGRGACEALIDAANLARQLGSTGDVDKALAGYDRARRRPTQRLAAVAYRVGRLAHARRLTGLRDLTVRAALAL